MATRLSPVHAHAVDDHVANPACQYPRPTLGVALVSTGLGSIQRAVHDYAEETARRNHHGWIHIDEIHDAARIIPGAPFSPAVYESIRRAISTLVERNILQKRRSPDGRRIAYRV